MKKTNKLRVLAETSLSRREFLKYSSATALSLGLSGILTNSLIAEASEGTMINVNGAGLFHDTVGSGTPMLIMHGGLGLDHSYFRPTLDSWGNFAELHFYDHRGNGRSTAPENWEDITIDSLVEDAEALRQSLGLEKFVLFGHSYGSFIAQEYALRYPDNLSGLILGNTIPNLSYPPNFPSWAPEEGLAAVGKLFSEPFATDEDWAQTWSTALPVYWKNPDPELLGDIHQRTHYKAAAWNRGSALLADYNTIDKLGDLTVPTLLLGGREDFITGPQAHEDMHKVLPNSTLAIFENSGHFPFITEKNVYKAVVQQWVEKL